VAPTAAPPIAPDVEGDDAGDVAEEQPADGGDRRDQADVRESLARAARPRLHRRHPQTM